MSKLLGLAATVSLVAVMGLTAVTASADSSCAPNPGGTTTCTIHAQDLPFAIQIVCPPPDSGGLLVASFSGVAHMTDNSNGSWDTSTLQGPATLFPDGSAPFVGHATAWFGLEANMDPTGILIPHDTADFHGMNALGQHADLHMNMHVTLHTEAVPPYATGVVDNMSC